MNIENIDLNKFIDKYVSFVDMVSSKHNYDSNLKHLLYIIVPAFIIKYDLKNEKLILKCFEEVPMVISGTENKNITASFNRRIIHQDGTYKSVKRIVINEYRTASLSNLLDNIIHEYNHAVNSYNNEVSYDDKYVKLRAGVSYMIFDRNTLRLLSKSKEVALEEIINTMQTEQIINIINSFNRYEISNYEFSNMLYTLSTEVRGTFKSEAYTYDSLLAKELINNKTFTPTITNLRLKGNIEDIPYLFDNVLDRDGEYNRLNELLTKIHKKEILYGERTLFKNMILKEIKEDSLKVINLIKEYDDKCIYKHT